MFKDRILLRQTKHVVENDLQQRVPRPEEYSRRVHSGPQSLGSGIKNPERPVPEIQLKVERPIHCGSYSQRGRLPG